MRPHEHQLSPLETAARELAEVHSVSDREPNAIEAWTRLNLMPEWLDRARRAALKAHPDYAKAAEWLLDNDYQVQRAVVQLRQDLPASYYRRLPRLQATSQAGLPRICGMACGLLHASRFQLSTEQVVSFSRAYQEITPLSIGELWALPTMLRLACIEMLVVSFSRLFPDLEPPFGTSDQSLLTELFDDTECAARALANLGIIASIPWKDVFDQVSLVEATLRGDPSGYYARMDFESRDRYRKSLEELASGSTCPETEVAEAAVARCRATQLEPPHNHVGHWLVGEGRDELEAALGYRPSISVVVRRTLMCHACPLYFGALAVVVLAALLLPGLYLAMAGAGLGLWALGIVLVLLPATVLGVTGLHWLVTLTVPPRVLPKLDFESGIPPGCSTVVVMPVLVSRPADVAPLLERMQAHHLSAPDPALKFVLLSDPGDASEERIADDEAVEQALMNGIRRLSARYGAGRFYLLHRMRRYNPAQGCWMAWERKRGKLEQFNRFVCGEQISDFCLCEGEPEALRGVRFVVTVDADTRLPPGGIARLVGTLAHPLNTARFDAETGRVRAGYTIVQPRVEITPECGTRSLFARLYTGDTAIDIYSRAVSDVYQDLFGSGIFIGKGIYEVGPFCRSLEGRVPENALVSHDLFEGAHGRTALATDIVLYETFPSGYVEYTRRWHRWVRGDWQLLPWLRSRVPGCDGKRLPNRLPMLERWKILDNLRRSLIPISLVALAAAGWLVLPGSPWVWTGLTIAAPTAFIFTDLVSGLARGRRRGAVRGTMRQALDHTGRWFLAVVFLVQDAFVAADAIVRTLWRLALSLRNLLEWTSAAHVAARFANGGSRADAWRHMWMASAFSGVLGGLLAILHPAALVPAAPLLALWLASPEIAALISRPRPHRVEQLGSGDRAFLRRLARSTWLYFETFVGPGDNWLPPDNFQEEPHAAIAHRTSPTNVGMMFLSSLSAWDLGYIGSSDLLSRQRNVLNALDRVERYRGHPLNWYDTRSLEPLEPRYVSTVDNGNLAVSLVALSTGCLEAVRQPALRAAQWDGLRDTLDLLARALDSLPRKAAAEPKSKLETMVGHVRRIRSTPSVWWTGLNELMTQDYSALEQAVSKAITGQDGRSPERLREISVWLERVHHHLASMQRDLEALYPWRALIEQPPEECGQLAKKIARLLPHSLSLERAESACATARNKLGDALRAAETGSPHTDWCRTLDAALAAGAAAHEALCDGMREIASRSEALAFSMDFTFLFDPETRLFHIGYNVTADRLDPHHYDLLASEARLASYFAIAKGDVPPEHWLFLGRPMAHMAIGPGLVSWNGSMFEYLMPPLLLPSEPNTIIGQSERAAVEVQRRYAEKFGIPWGMSESGLASRDAEYNYRYSAFGVPDLGLRRGLSRDLVVAPYATALALAVRPATAVRNLRHLERIGGAGRYGLIEALDYTAARREAGREFTPVRAFMAHHQGMILTAIGNALFDDVHAHRFAVNPRMRAFELLLQERIPWEFPPEIERKGEREIAPPRPNAIAPPQPWKPDRADSFAQVHALGNGRLASWISEAGAGGLFWHGMALTRWRPDATRDNHGLWIYVRDEDSGAVWSIGRQPTGIAGTEADVVFHPHIAEFHRLDHGISITMDVGVAVTDDVEIRRISIVNQTDRPRTLLLTSAAEVVLAPPLDDERHPAFSKLFVGSELVPGLNGLLFTRRPRHPEVRAPALLHRMIADNPDLTLAGFEGSRRALLGRNGSAKLPRGVTEGLSGTLGWTLDPVMALQIRLELEPRGRRQLAFLTMAAGSRESVLELAEHYTTLASLDWAFGDAAREARREAQGLGLEPDRLPEIQLLASMLIHPNIALRAGPELIRANRLGQPRLWTFGLSGDRPILLVHSQDARETDLLRLLIRAHRYWHRRGIDVDLVILRAGASGYEEPLRDQFFKLVGEIGAQEHIAIDGGIHMLFADHIGRDDSRMVEAAAAVVLDTSHGPLGRQLANALQPKPEMPAFAPTIAARPAETAPDLARPEDLLFDNGLGGFTPDGREYVIQIGSGDTTPVPWANILSNDQFGTIVTEAGLGFSFAVNSGENRLTPWNNDPVADAPGEAVYLRDEETAEIWTASPGPAGFDSACQIRHGAGYTKWRQAGHGLEQELLVFVPPDDPVKIARLRLRNRLSQPRRLTATYYAEWVLGALASISRQHVVCDYDAGLHALLARNSWNPEFEDRVAFLTSSHPPHSLTTDRQDFLGREGDYAAPAGLLSWDLGGRLPPRADPCAAYQVHVEIDANGTADIVFILGQGDDQTHAAALVKRWQAPGHVDEAFVRLNSHWDDLLGAVRVKTPDVAFDLMINRWLLYQAMASRLLARAGFYQAGGAFGFRDQLQDVLALLHADPGRARAHILACASRQFEEGDVLHWWHPPSGRGVRTRCSDDLMWLPYVTGCYVAATGDESILHEEVPFLQGPPLAEEELDRYARFDTAPRSHSLFEHCERALERGVTEGAHDLPLIGTGDWNDSMDRIGHAMRGESVWLAWFAIATIEHFVVMAGRLGQDHIVERWTARAAELREAVEAAAWDGGWYLRAFDDDGRPWGSASNEECRIDVIAQSWAVLSGAARPDRARAAIEAARDRLIADDERIIRLLWPPFDKTSRNPGYIKAYPPGIRENGGQYTHGATWLGFAFANLGDGDMAARVFELINPIGKTMTRADIERYQVEPYVVAADVAGAAPHTGKGGWTWYTGAAGWAWRLGVEAILGLSLNDGKLKINPCLPQGWSFFEAEVRGPEGALSIHVNNAGRGDESVVEIEVDGKLQESDSVTFPTDGSVRPVNVRVRGHSDASRKAARIAKG